MLLWPWSGWIKIKFSSIKNIIKNSHYSTRVHVHTFLMQVSPIQGSVMLRFWKIVVILSKMVIQKYEKNSRNLTKFLHKNMLTRLVTQRTQNTTMSKVISFKWIYCCYWFIYMFYCNISNITSFIFSNCRNNFMKLDIFFGELKYEKVVQQRGYDIPTFFSKSFLCISVF